MKANPVRLDAIRSWRVYGRALYEATAPHAHTIIIFAALFCNLAVKLFHAGRSGLLPEYPKWILTDLAVLLTIEAALSLLCYRRPTIRTLRIAMVIAAIVCTWSVLNAGWLIRTGTQILPMDLRPLFRDPVNILKLVAKNLLAMPAVATVLLVPSAIALAFFFSALVRARPPCHIGRRLYLRIAFSLVVAVAAVIANMAVSTLGSLQIAAAGMRFNCQSRAVLSFVLPGYRHVVRTDFRNATREIPRHDTIPVALNPRWINHNVVIVILEGVQYDCTSLALQQGGIAPQRGPNLGGLTPHLARIADEGVSFTNARSVVTHTTKAIFGLLTGRPPSAAQDISETVPMDQPYASLATILKKGLGFRTAFFQSATGTFESRPGLVHNLGFDKFFAREDLHDPNEFVGYLGADEFAMLEPIAEWIQSDNTPFLVVILCSVTHDPYYVPAWFGTNSGDHAERYFETIMYTDRFLAALDVQLAELNLAEDTIFCVVGDHGEAFSEHRMMGHERITYDEVLRVVMCLRAPHLIAPGLRITEPVSSIDLTPTILGLLGFDIEPMQFDGSNALAPLPPDRRVYLSGWMQQGPAGFVQGSTKIVYHPEHNRVKLFRLNSDPLELNGIDLPTERARRLSEEIVEWRRGTIFRMDEDAKGETVLFDAWLSRWSGRTSKVKYIESR
jgi:hypothetical protein